MRALPSLFVFLFVVTSSTSALALYKVVGPDGKVTYTDQPPPDSKATAAMPPGRMASPGSSAAPLPYALAQVVAKFPVVLFTREQCAPCDSGREHLKQRGVPFTEKTVNTAADATALQRQEATSTLPILRIGQQQLRGYAGTDWNSYLDAAGYPQKSTLPANYKAPAPQALVAAELAAPPDGKTSTPSATADSPPRPSRPATQPSTGIKF